MRQAAGEGAALLYSHSGLAADRDSPGASGWARSSADAGLCTRGRDKLPFWSANGRVPLQVPVLLPMPQG